MFNKLRQNFTYTFDYSMFAHKVSMKNNLFLDGRLEQSPASN
jgi:hypothetical protein